MITKKEIKTAFALARNEANWRKRETCHYRRGPGVEHCRQWRLVVSVNDVEGGHIYNAHNERNGKDLSGFTAVDKIVDAVFEEESRTAPKIKCAC
jgi:hypothetical protein